MAYTPVIFFFLGEDPPTFILLPTPMYIYIHGCITAYIYIYIYAVIPHTALLSHSKLPQGKFLHRDSPTHASVFWSQLLHLMHSTRTHLIDPCEACSEWNPSWKTSVWPWPLYCNSVPGCYWTSYSLGHLCGEQQFYFSNPQRVLCHEVPCWTSSGQYERIVLKAPNFNCSKTRYTNLYGPVKQTKTWTWWMGHVALHG